MSTVGVSAQGAYAIVHPVLTQQERLACPLLELIVTEQNPEGALRLSGGMVPSLGLQKCLYVIPGNILTDGHLQPCAAIYFSFPSFSTDNKSERKLYTYMLDFKHSPNMTYTKSKDVSAILVQQANIVAQALKMYYIRNYGYEMIVPSINPSNSDIWLLGADYISQIDFGLCVDDDFTFSSWITKISVTGDIPIFGYELQTGRFNLMREQLETRDFWTEQFQRESDLMRQTIERVPGASKLYSINQKIANDRKPTWQKEGQRLQDSIQDRSTTTFPGQPLDQDALQDSSMKTRRQTQNASTQTEIATDAGDGPARGAPPSQSPGSLPTSPTPGPKMIEIKEQKRDGVIFDTVADPYHRRGWAREPGFRIPEVWKAPPAVAGPVKWRWPPPSLTGGV